MRLARRAQTDGPRSVVVLPSRTVDRWHEPPAETQAYEERLLSFVLELRDLGLHMVYITSLAIAPATIAYHLSLLPASARLSVPDRLTLVTLHDPSARPLSEKLLERPDALERIRRAIRGRERSYLMPYNSTTLERDVGLSLGLPVYGADPVHRRLGTKSGSRELFARTRVPHPVGTEHIRSLADAIDAVCRLRAATPGLTEMVVKLNDGVSGEGNAIVDVTDLPAPSAAQERRLVGQRLAAMIPEIGSVTTAAYLCKLADQGGVVEERITGLEVRSPSVQLEISPAGEVEVLSTHDQILGGRSGQLYLGCRFPADRDYAAVIAQLSRRVAEHLAGQGVTGRFGIDFVVTRRGERRWEAFALELNLRLGGTTHPHQTLLQLTGGRYDSERARFTTPQGRSKHYVATDYLEAHRLRRLGPQWTLRQAARHRLSFDHERGVGVVFHMLSSIASLGRVGLTAIAETAEQADALYEEIRGALTTGRASAAA